MANKIFKEIDHIFTNPNNRGDLINELTDEFRDGRDPRILCELLESDNNKFIEIGLYIINEIIIEDHQLLTNISRALYKLIKNSDSYIRYKAFVILSQILEDLSRNEECTDLYLIVYKDEDKDIRESGIKLLKDGHLR